MKMLIVLTPVLFWMATLAAEMILVMNGKPMSNWIGIGGFGLALLSMFSMEVKQK